MRKHHLSVTPTVIGWPEHVLGFVLGAALGMLLGFLLAH